MNHLPAIQHAMRVHEARKVLTREQLANEVIALAEWRCFSNRHISALTGLHPSAVGEYTQKFDKTGGRLNPDALPLIAKLIQAPLPDSALIVATLDAGVSAHLLARFTGLSQVTLSRRARAWRAAQ